MHQRTHLAVIISLVLAIVFATASLGQSRAATVAVRAPTSSGASGEEADIPISVAGASGIGALHVELIYDPAVLEVKTVDKGQLLSENALLDFNGAAPGRLIIGVVSLDAIQGDGAVLLPRFTVKGKKDQTSPLELENVKAWEGSTRLDVLVTTEPGQFTVTGAGFPWLYLLLALLVALLALILLFALRRRRPQAVPRTVPAAPAPARVTQATAGERFCTQCGTPAQPGQQFCSNCGAQL